MNWLKRIFFGDPHVVDTGTSPADRKVEEVVEEPVFKPSDPVLAMYECYVKDRKRFRIKRVDDMVRIGPHVPVYSEFVVTDRKTGEKYRLSYSTSWHKGRWSHCKPEWMTSEEAFWLYDNISEHYNTARKRLKQIRESRKQRRIQAERDRLTALYRGED